MYLMANAVVCLSAVHTIVKMQPVQTKIQIDHRLL